MRKLLDQICILNYEFGSSVEDKWKSRNVMSYSGRLVKELLQCYKGKTGLGQHTLNGYWRVGGKC